MEDRINETAVERQERYEVAFLEYLDENEACGIAIEDWANEHGLDSEYLTKTGLLSGFAIPLGKSIRKQREDFSAPFEPTTADTEIAPIVRREESKAVMRAAPKPVIDKPKTETSENRPKRKPGRPKKTTAPAAVAETPKEPISTAPTSRHRWRHRELSERTTSSMSSPVRRQQGRSSRAPLTG